MVGIRIERENASENMALREITRSRIGIRIEKENTRHFFLFYI